jgi:hypothetical protein
MYAACMRCRWRFCDGSAAVQRGTLLLCPRRLSCLLINDIDAGIGVFANTQRTVRAAAQQGRRLTLFPWLHHVCCCASVRCASRAPAGRGGLVTRRLCAAGEHADGGGHADEPGRRAECGQHWPDLAHPGAAGRAGCGLRSLAPGMSATFAAGHVRACACCHKCRAVVGGRAGQDTARAHHRHGERPVHAVCAARARRAHGQVSSRCPLT